MVEPQKDPSLQSPRFAASTPKTAVLGAQGLQQPAISAFAEPKLASPAPCPFDQSQGGLGSFLPLAKRRDATPSAATLHLASQLLLLSVPLHSESYRASGRSIDQAQTCGNRGGTHWILRATVQQYGWDADVGAAARGFRPRDRTLGGESVAFSPRCSVLLRVMMQDHQQMLQICSCKLPDGLVTWATSCRRSCR